MKRSLPKRSPALLIAIGLGALAIAIACGVVAIWMFMRGVQAPPAVVQTAQAGDVRVTMQLDDAALGLRVIDVLLRDAADNPIDAEAVRLRFTMAEMDMGQIEVDAQPLGRGRYQARGLFFSMVGAWQVQAMLDRGGQPPAQASFAIAIAAPGEASGPLNPLRADAATMAAGQVIYQANCVVCHGANRPGRRAAGGRAGPAPVGLFAAHADRQAHRWPDIPVGQGWLPRHGHARLGRAPERRADLAAGHLSCAPSGRPRAVATAPVEPLATAVATAAPAEVREPLPPMVFARERGLWRSAGDGQPPRQLIGLDAGLRRRAPGDLARRRADRLYPARAAAAHRHAADLDLGALCDRMPAAQASASSGARPAACLAHRPGRLMGRTIYVGLVDGSLRAIRPGGRAGLSDRERERGDGRAPR